MTVVPIVERELRMQARLLFTYWLRVLGAGVLLATSVFFGADEGFGFESGSQLFGHLNAALFWSIWLLVPVLPADCISREKREGTLGLLFLTPLRGSDIVLAKGLVHGLRALTLWLAVLPILMIPFPLGGLTWKEATLATTTDFSCLCWALAAGILASAMAKTWARSVVLAYLFWVCCFLAFSYFHGAILAPLLAPSGFSSFSGNSYQYVVERHHQLLWMGLLGSRNPGWLLSVIPVNEHGQLLKADAMTAAASVLVLLAVIVIAARRLETSWQERPPPAWRLRWERTMCTPVLWVGFFRRWLRRKLERNPIGWLEQRTWSGRLVTWGWFAVMVSLYSVAFTGPGIGRAFQALQNLMAWLLIVSLAASAAGSFRRERETGVLELLLVSPLSETQIIHGRLKGLWGQFLPALVMLLSVWIYFARFFAWQQNLRQIEFCVTSFLSLPVIGLYFSLRQSNFISAALYTIFFGLVVPTGLPMILATLVDINPYRFIGAGDALQFLHLVVRLTQSQGMAISLQIGLAAYFGRRLNRDLARRNFAFSHSA